MKSTLITITRRCEAHAKQGAQWHNLQCDLSLPAKDRTSVRVWDCRANRYTACHSLGTQSRAVCLGIARKQAATLAR